MLKHLITWFMDDPLAKLKAKENCSNIRGSMREILENYLKIIVYIHWEEKTNISC